MYMNFIRMSHFCGGASEPYERMSVTLVVVS